MRRQLPLLLLTILLPTLFLLRTPVSSGYSGEIFAPGTHLRFEHLTIDNGLSQNSGLALLQDRQGFMWIGTQDGLNRYDGYHLVQFINDPAISNSLSSDLVMSLYTDSDDTLWVGTLGGVVNHFDPNSGLFTRYQNDPASLLENQVTYITRGPAGRLWVGTFAGLSRLDLAANGFVNYPLPAPATAYTMIGAELWVGTWDGGVYRLDLSDPASKDPAKAAFTILAHDPANPNSLSHNAVWSIFQSPDGLIWLATEGGLNRYNPQTSDFKVYTTKDGLAKFDPQAETFQIYDKSDGLQGNEFNSNAYFQSQDGDFYIGGVSGFSVFNPLELHPTKIPPQVAITDFSIFNESQTFDPSAESPIRLNYDQNFISFEFAALDFHAQTQNQYAYKLEGFDKDWVQAGTRNYASYTNLPGGEYTFRVRAANSDGVWNQTGTSLRLNVTPPFWQTWPFLLGLLLGVVSLVALVFQLRVRAVRQQNTRLQTLVNEQQRVEAELRQSEARFRAIYENAAIGISLIAPDGHVLAVNPVLSKLSGRSETELMAIGGQELTYPDDKDIGRQEFYEVISGARDSYQAEKRYVHKDGHVQWMRQSVSAVRDENGQVQYMVVIAEDIDERKRAIEALRESETRFRTLYDSAEMGIVLVDLGHDGNMPLDEIRFKQLVSNQQLNPAMLRMFGYTAEEMQNIAIDSLIYPADRGIDRQEFRQLLTGEIDSYHIEKRFVRKDGGVFWGRLTDSLARTSDDAPQMVIGIIEDITNEREARQTLAESEARFRAMFENSAVGIGLMSIDRIILDANPAMCTMLGYTREELIGQSPAMATHPEDFLESTRQFKQLLSGEINYYIAERRYMRKNGEAFWTQISMSLVRDPQGKPLYLVGLINDIDAEKRVAERLAAQEAEHLRRLELRIAERTEELNLANERLREKAAQDAVANERTRLARDLHDAVTQTLFSATLIAEVLPDIWEMNPDEGKRRLEEIRQLTRGALAEMRTLLVELRPNALVEVPLPTLLRQLTEALIGRTRMNIQLNAEGERKLPPDVQVGLYRLAQEAMNNVVKHAKASQAVVTLRCSDEAVRLTVADNGIGFDPSTVTSDHLGLKIMRERAEAMGAKLIVYSEAGDGTQISVVWEEKPLTAEDPKFKLP